jgi:yeast amino acid transporter
MKDQTSRMDGMREHKKEYGVKDGETNPEFNLADPRKQLERGLKSRHIQFLALGTAADYPPKT